MGYQLNRFIGNVDELLICFICHDVLQSPMQCAICERPFCQSCISSWISNNATCPASRHHMLLEHVVCVPRILRNLLDRLQIKCIFAENGCQAQLTLENLRAHEASCEKNPNAMATCDEGCGLSLPRSELEEHSCLFKLRVLVEQQRDQIQQLQLRLAAQEKLVDIHKNELQNVHHFIYCLRRRCPAIGNIGQNWDRYCLKKWGLKLPVALVRNWDNFISRPNYSLTLDLKYSLHKQGCPMQLIDKLVNNSREVNAFEFLHGYRLRLLQPLSSGKQCVLILGDENNHMPVNLMRLGLIMVFENGVEIAVADTTTDTDTESEDSDGDDDGAWGPARPQMMSFPINAYRERDSRVSDSQVSNNGVGALQDSSFHAGHVTVPQVGSNENCVQTTVSPINSFDTTNVRTWGAPISRPPLMSLPIDAYRERGYPISDRRVINNGVETRPNTISNASFVTISQVGSNANTAPTAITPINDLVTNNERANGPPISAFRVVNNGGVAGRPPVGATNIICGTPVSGLRSWIDVVRAERASRLNLYFPPVVTYSGPPPTNTTAALNVGNGEQQGDDSGNNGNFDDVV